MHGYCLMNGSSLTYDGQTLVESSENLYLETDSTEGRIYLNTPSETTIAFYWAPPFVNITESGTDLLFSIDKDLVTLKISAGYHILEVK